MYEYFRVKAIVGLRNNSMIKFKMGLKKQITTLHPGVFYTAYMMRKNRAMVVTFIRRSYYEEVDNAPLNSVVFRTPERQYKYWGLNPEKVRHAIRSAYMLSGTGAVQT